MKTLRSIAMSILLLAVATFAADADPVPALRSGERWLTVASTKDLDTAKGIAGYYSVTGAKVVKAQDGWLAIVLGPYKAQSVEEVKKLVPALGEDFPTDAILSNGGRYEDVLWQAGPDPGLDGPLTEYSADKPARLSTGKLSVDVSLSGDEDNPGPTTAKGTANGQPAFEFVTPADFVMFGSTAGLLRLDPESEYPQLVFTRYTGGAHCCTMTWIVTKPKSAAAWSMLDGLMLDGDAGYGFEDLDGDGSLELSAIDNRFLYGFSSYVDSYSVTRYYRLRGARLEDVTASPEFLPHVKQQVAWMEFSAKIRPDLWASNGFLAAWLAAKNLIGEGAEAWSKMELSYEKTSDFGPQECTTGQTVDDCPADKLVAIPFPRALAEFLRDGDYGPLPEKARKLLP